MPKTKIKKRHLELPLLPEDSGVDSSFILDAIDGEIGTSWKERDSALEVKNKLESIVTESDKLDASAIKNLPSSDVVSVNGETGVVVLNADDIDDSSTGNKFVDSTEKSKLANIPSDQTALNDDIELRVSINDAKISYPGDQDISGIGVNSSRIDSLDQDKITQDAAIAANTAKISYPGDQDISGIGVNASAITALDNNKLEAGDFKTINNESIVGSGNISISGGSGGDEYNNIYRDSTDSGLVGNVDGTNTSFTVSNGSYNPATLNVFVEGQLFTAGHGITETSPGTGVFTFENAPRVGTNLYVTYQVGNLTTDILDGSIIESKLSSDVITKFGNVPNGYISPRTYGAIMDGVTDDRTAFMSTLSAANTLGKRIYIDSDMFLDVEELATKSIFIPDNIWIEGRDKDVNIIYNNKYSPAFVIALSDNITFKNFTFLYDQTIDATVTSNESVQNAANITQYKNYLTNEKGITFTSSNPIWRGPTLYMSTLLIAGGKYITIDNVKFKARGENAPNFIPWAIKFKEEHSKNITVTNDVEAETTIPQHITFKDVVLDGTIMGVQGIVRNFNCDGLKSYRYSDMQSLDGSNVGGVGYWMAPPHLFYINSDNALVYNPGEVKLTNTIDYGEYVGTPNVRPTISGYCNSLKMVTANDNNLVDGYITYRRDGFADFGDLTNVTIKNVYAECKSDIFDSTFKFTPLRFVGDIDGCVFENIEIRDISDVAHVYPVYFATGNNTIYNNMHLFVNGLDVGGVGFFGISGSNNKILNSSLNIKNHTSTSEFIGVIYHNSTARSTGSNNYYNVLVNGWRKFGSNVGALKSRTLFAAIENPNNNYAKLTDTNNNWVSEQINEMERNTWTRSEIVDITANTEQALTLDIPSGYAVKKIETLIIEAFDAGTTVSIGTLSGSANNLIPSMSTSVGNRTTVDINEEYNSTAYRQIFVRTSTGTFNSLGEFKITLTLTRTVTN
ncbi:structural protein [Cellulophaga phage phi4:1]|uniref:Structural protein n=5 Tax=Lightbulbvirus TaxID=1918522 RepID=A0A0S2MWL8_9CAUD|nr:pectate lyase [Cellulophaga phage phi4:1]YP_008241549.1 pectate lyase [Cellulophaga phage phi17:2]ALO80061.1 structural protein [Cellulophaga phage phi4:1_13]ALO80258.1 structural protein [Cellulophaga phage phi4:1_18]ALO80457.1 structural protein [Cellulophaga phage phi17:2_18]AGO47587.1 structural protein [Cellulophaga phage phi17:2]AGO49465.1 structural protein [Cellulophaga phage phi4:1]